MKEKRRTGIRTMICEERGDILAVSAVFLTVMILFAGIAVDFSVIYMEKSRLNDYCQIARECRYTHDTRIMYSEDPGRELARIIENALHDNAFDVDEKAAAVLSFTEEPPTECHRSYTATLKLSKECPTHFLRLFRLNSVPISSEIQFSDEFGTVAGEAADAGLGEDLSAYIRIWHPVLVEGGYRLLDYPLFQDRENE